MRQPALPPPPSPSTCYGLFPQCGESNKTRIFNAFPPASLGINKLSDASACGAEFRPALTIRAEKNFGATDRGPLPLDAATAGEMARGFRQIFGISSAPPQVAFRTLKHRGFELGELCIHGDV